MAPSLPFSISNSPLVAVADRRMLAGVSISRRISNSRSCAFDPLHQRNECRHVERAALRHHLHGLLAHEVGMLDGADTGLEAASYTLLGIDMCHDIGAARGGLLDHGGKLRLREFVARRMALGGKHHATRGEQLDLGSAPAQLLACRPA